MALDADITAVLKTQCTQTFPDFAPAGTALPWVTWQAIGGHALRWLDGTAADKRHTTVQISVWSASRLQTSALIRAIEDALCAATTFTARPVAEPVSDADEALGYYGATQDFSLYSLR